MTEFWLTLATVCALGAIAALAVVVWAARHKEPRRNRWGGGQ